MKLIKAEFLKKHLKQLSKEEEIFFVQLTHLLDELMILSKCVIFSSNAIETKQGLEKTAQSTQALFFIRVLAGKIYEGWQMLHASYFSTQLSQEYDKLLSGLASESIEKLKKYFAENNLIHEIRNKYAFHYDRKNVEDQLNRVAEDETLSMLISEQQGNSLFAFSSTIINSSILNSINPKDQQKAMDALVEEVILKVCKWFQNFGYGVVELIIEKLRFDCEEIELEDVSTIEDVELPFFVEKGNQSA
ncbi:hypothetical protein KAW55_02520 [bacterium]|nr:hypothetical protein [bacterium]